MDITAALDYFCEYDMLNELMNFTLTRIRCKSVDIDECDFSFCRKYIADEKRQKIFLYLKNQVKNDQEALKKAVHAYICNTMSQITFESFLSFKNQKNSRGLLSDVENIKNEQTFHIFYPNFVHKKKVSPILTYKCTLSDGQINVLEVIPNTDKLALILAQQYDCGLSEAREIYREQIDSASMSVCALQKTANFHVLRALVNSEIKKALNMDIDLTSMSFCCGWNMMRAAFITFEQVDDLVNSCFRKELGSIKTLCKSNLPLPKSVEKYLNGNPTAVELTSKHKSDEFHYGSYTDKYAVNEKQWKIAKLIDHVDMLCVEGPPGTGKTALLKEVIANVLVEKAFALLHVWDVPWEKSRQNKGLFVSPLGGENRHSVIITSTNNKAVDNIGLELLQEIPYFKSFIENCSDENKEGILCAKLGCAENINDFYNLTYNPFCKFLIDMKLPVDYEEKIVIAFKKRYEVLSEINGQITVFLKQRETMLSQGIKTEQDYNGLQQATSKKRELLEQQIKQISEEQVRCKQELEIIVNLLADNRCELLALENGAQETEAEIKQLYSDLDVYSQLGLKKRLAFLFPKARALVRKYPSERYIFDAITDKRSSERRQRYAASELKNSIFKNEKEKEKLASKCDQLRENKNALDADLGRLKTEEKEVSSFIQRSCFLQQKLGLPASRLLDMSEYELRNHKNFVQLRNQLFKFALRLFEVYIVKNKEPIVSNLNNFITKNDCYINWGSIFFNNEKPYTDRKANEIRNLWETFCLCFPVISTTLHSFRQKVFQIIPELFDLLLIDESGQIMPYYVVAPLYRVRRALFVGDDYQLEPIRVVPQNMLKHYKERLGGQNYKRLCVDFSSAQTYAVAASDVYECTARQRQGIILNEHRRCEKSIMQFSNQYIYSNRLHLLIPDSKDKLFGDNLVAFDIRGEKSEQHVNWAEIEACRQIVEKLIKKYGKDITKDISIITPFKNQKEKLKEEIQDKTIEIGTVHNFQGGEKRFVIFSTVIDFSTEKKLSAGLFNFIGLKGNMLNVAFSRAKTQLIFVGNFEAIKQSAYYLKKALETVEQNGTLFSLFETDRFDLKKSGAEEAIEILTGYPCENSNDQIGEYLKTVIPLGIVDSPKLHNTLLKALLKKAEREVNIISPWIGANVVNREFLDVLKSRVSNGVKCSISFGYKQSTLTLDCIQQIVELDMPWEKEAAVHAITALYEILGERLVYRPPTHVKLLLIDDAYLFVGSLNWLMNSGKTNTSESSCLITNRDTINYVKKRYIS